MNYHYDTKNRGDQQSTPAKKQIPSQEPRARFEVPALEPTPANLPILTAREGFRYALAKDDPTLAKAYQAALYRALDQRQKHIDNLMLSAGNRRGGN